MKIFWEFEKNLVAALCSFLTSPELRSCARIRSDLQIFLAPINWRQLSEECLRQG